MHSKFNFKATVWLYSGQGAWHFVTLPKETAQEIDFYFKELKRGWGSLPVKVTLGSTTWKTSIFPDKKNESYLLPIKAEVRRNEKIEQGDKNTFSIEVTS